MFGHGQRARHGVHDDVVERDLVHAHLLALLFEELAQGLDLGAIEGDVVGQLRHVRQRGVHGAGDDLADVGQRLGVAVVVGRADFHLRGGSGGRGGGSGLGGEVGERHAAAQTGAFDAAGIRAARSGADHAASVQKRLHVALDDAAIRAGGTDKGEVRACALGKRLGARRDLQIAGDDGGLSQFLRRSGGLNRGGGCGSFLLGGFRGGFARGGELGRTLARRADDANVRQAGNVVPFLEKDIQKRAFDLGFLVKGGLVGLIGEQNVADLHRVALLLGPLGDDTALNGVSLPGHDHCNCHKNPPNAYCSHISVEFLLNCIHSNSYIWKNQSKRAKFSKP